MNTQHNEFQSINEQDLLTATGGGLITELVGHIVGEGAKHWITEKLLGHAINDVDMNAEDKKAITHAGTAIITTLLPI